MFEIRLSKDFIDYSNNLSLQRKIILDTHIFYVENTGYLGNCKVLGKGIFEFKIKGFDLLFCNIDNTNNIITFFLDKQYLEQELTNWKSFLKDRLSDIKYMKAFFNQFMKFYQEVEEDSFLQIGLRLIFEIHGGNNFKEITGFDYEDINMSNSIKTLQDLIKRLKLYIKIKSLEQVSKSTEI